MMQTYGFCRIYDAKTGSFATLTRRLDFAACATWFAAAVLLSSQRMADTLETYYASGAPFIPPWLLHNAQQVMLAGAIAVSILFLFNFSRMWADGNRVVRGFSRCAVPLARLDLQSQPCGKGQLHRRLHALCVSAEWLIDWTVHRACFCLRFARVFQFTS